MPLTVDEVNIFFSLDEINVKNKIRVQVSGFITLVSDAEGL